MYRLSQLLAKKRSGRGLRETAKEIGISPATLSRIERGKEPSLSNFVKICKWLEVDPGPILGFRPAQTIPILTDEDYAYLGKAVELTIRRFMRGILSNI
jgi:DNA-binding Xre family transcriptional regulator